MVKDGQTFLKYWSKKKMKNRKNPYDEKFSEFYNSKRWKNLRNQIFYDCDGLCQICKQKGIIREGVDVHHKISIEKDWNKRFDYDNLILLCKDCHNKIHERISPLQEFLDDWENL